AVSLYGQNVGIGTDEPSEKLEVNGIIFTSPGGIKFPDGTIQTTAYTPGSSMMQVGLSALVIEFAAHPSIHIQGPANDAMITNGINVASVQEGAGVAIQLVGNMLESSMPSLSEITFSRSSDKNSAQFKNLLYKGTAIPYIEVFFLRMIDETYYVDHIARYEN